MARKIYGPGVDLDQYALSIKKGGTSADNVADAVNKLGLVTQSMLGSPKGVLQLDSEGKISLDKLNTESLQKVMLFGQDFFIPGETGYLHISNFDSFTNYSINVNTGSCFLNGDIIEITVPTDHDVLSPIVLTITVDNNTIIERLLRPDGIRTPVFNGLVNDQVTISNVLTLELSDFIPVITDQYIHDSTDWEISTDNSFTNIVFSSLNDGVNKLSITTSVLTLDTVHYIRARFKSFNGIYSNYAIVKIKTPLTV